jgi:predicted metal-dependent phosphoesterase TrpH
VKDGLRGIEVYHSDHPPQIALHYEEIAAKYNLLMTGGSDCHGAGKGRVLLGEVKIMYELVEKLKAEADRIRNLNDEV